MILDLTGSEQELINCMGCEIISGHLKPFGGILFKNENFFIAQDFELPIDGFIIISSVRHIEKYTELTENEQIDLTKIINKTLKILEDNNIAEEYNIIFEEKKGYHFHIWLMPRHKWMIEKYGKDYFLLLPALWYDCGKEKNAAIRYGYMDLVTKLYEKI